MFFSLHCFAQEGGIRSFSSIDIDMSARSESMGGDVISIIDDDISLSQIAPSLLNKRMNNKMLFSFVDYFADINLLGFAYVKRLQDIAVFSIGVRAIDYGDFEYNDEAGNNLGSFKAGDQIITFGGSKILSNYFTLGTNFNVINSQYEIYRALVLYTNTSITYCKESFTSTLLVKNFGRQLKSYTDIKEDLPLDIQFSLSKELQHLPFRYILTFHHLNKFNISSPYKLTSQTNFQTGELEIKDESIAKTFLRHMIIGGELNPFRKKIFFRGGLNFQRRFDMTLLTAPKLVGFSWGMGFSYARFRFDYSRSAYHLSGYLNSFSITSNLNQIGL